MTEYVAEPTLVIIGIAIGRIRFVTTGTTRLVVVAVIVLTIATPLIAMLAAAAAIFNMLNKSGCSSNKKHDHDNNKQNGFA